MSNPVSPPVDFKPNDQLEIHFSIAGYRADNPGHPDLVQVDLLLVAVPPNNNPVSGFNPHDSKLGNQSIRMR
jgi:hypothetical protein